MKGFVSILLPLILHITPEILGDSDQITHYSTRIRNGKDGFIADLRRSRDSKDSELYRHLVRGHTFKEKSQKKDYFSYYSKKLSKYGNHYNESDVSDSSDVSNSDMEKLGNWKKWISNHKSKLRRKFDSSDSSSSDSSGSTSSSESSHKDFARNKHGNHKEHKNHGNEDRITFSKVHKKWKVDKRFDRTRKRQENLKENNHSVKDMNLKENSDSNSFSESSSDRFGKNKENFSKSKIVDKQKNSNDSSDSIELESESESSEEDSPSVHESDEENESDHSEQNTDIDSNESLISSSQSLSNNDSEYDSYKNSNRTTKTSGKNHNGFNDRNVNKDSWLNSDSEESDESNDSSSEEQDSNIQILLNELNKQGQSTGNQKIVNKHDLHKILQESMINTWQEMNIAIKLLFIDNYRQTKKALLTEILNNNNIDHRQISSLERKLKQYYYLLKKDIKHTIKLAKLRFRADTSRIKYDKRRVYEIERQHISKLRQDIDLKCKTFNQNIISTLDEFHLSLKPTSHFVVTEKNIENTITKKTSTKVPFDGVYTENVTSQIQMIDKTSTDSAVSTSYSEIDSSTNTLSEVDDSDNFGGTTVLSQDKSLYSTSESARTIADQQGIHSKRPVQLRPTTRHYASSGKINHDKLTTIAEEKRQETTTSSARVMNTESIDTDQTNIDHSEQIHQITESVEGVNISSQNTNLNLTTQKTIIGQDSHQNVVVISETTENIPNITSSIHSSSVNVDKKYIHSHQSGDEPEISNNHGSTHADYSASSSRMTDIRNSTTSPIQITVTNQSHPEQTSKSTESEKFPQYGHQSQSAEPTITPHQYIDIDPNHSLEHIHGSAGSTTENHTILSEGSTKTVNDDHNPTSITDQTVSVDNHNLIYPTENSIQNMKNQSYSTDGSTIIPEEITHIHNHKRTTNEINTTPHNFDEKNRTTKTIGSTSTILNHSHQFESTTLSTNDLESIREINETVTSSYTESSKGDQNNVTIGNHTTQPKNQSIHESSGSVENTIMPSHSDKNKTKYEHNDDDSTQLKTNMSNMDYQNHNHRTTVPMPISTENNHSIVQSTIISIETTTINDRIETTRHGHLNIDENNENDTDHSAKPIHSASHIVQSTTKINYPHPGTSASTVKMSDNHETTVSNEPNQSVLSTAAVENITEKESSKFPVTTAVPSNNDSSIQSGLETETWNNIESHHDSDQIRNYQHTDARNDSTSTDKPLTNISKLNHSLEPNTSTLETINSRHNVTQNNSTILQHITSIENDHQLTTEVHTQPQYIYQSMNITTSVMPDNSDISTQSTHSENSSGQDHLDNSRSTISSFGATNSSHTYIPLINHENGHTNAYRHSTNKPMTTIIEPELGDHSDSSISTVKSTDTSNNSDQITNSYNLGHENSSLEPTTTSAVSQQTRDSKPTAPPIQTSSDYKISSIDQVYKHSTERTTEINTHSQYSDNPLRPTDSSETPKKDHIPTETTDEWNSSSPNHNHNISTVTPILTTTKLHTIEVQKVDNTEFTTSASKSSTEQKIDVHSILESISTSTGSQHSDVISTTSSLDTYVSSRISDNDHHRQSTVSPIDTSMIGNHHIESQQADHLESTIHPLKLTEQQFETNHHHSHTTVEPIVTTKNTPNSNLFSPSSPKIEMQTDHQQINIDHHETIHSYSESISTSTESQHTYHSKSTGPPLGPTEHNYDPTMNMNTNLLNNTQTTPSTTEIPVTTLSSESVDILKTSLATDNTQKIDIGNNNSNNDNVTNNSGYNSTPQEISRTTRTPIGTINHSHDSEPTIEQSYDQNSTTQINKQNESTVIPHNTRHTDPTTVSSTAESVISNTPDISVNTEQNTEPVSTTTGIESITNSLDDHDLDTKVTMKSTISDTHLNSNDSLRSTELPTDVNTSTTNLSTTVTVSENTIDQSVSSDNVDEIFDILTALLENSEKMNEEMNSVKLDETIIQDEVNELRNKNISHVDSSKNPVHDSNNHTTGIIENRTDNPLSKTSHHVPATEIINNTTEGVTKMNEMISSTEDNITNKTEEITTQRSKEKIDECKDGNGIVIDCESIFLSSNNKIKDSTIINDGQFPASVTSVWPGVPQECLPLFLEPDGTIHKAIPENYKKIEDPDISNLCLTIAQTIIKLNN